MHVKVEIINIVEANEYTVLTINTKNMESFIFNEEHLSLESITEKKQESLMPAEGTAKIIYIEQRP